MATGGFASKPGDHSYLSDCEPLDSQTLRVPEDSLSSISNDICSQIPELKKNAEFLGEILRFYTKELSKAHEASLLHDYVESEFFLIDGDSLLITCVLDQSLKAGQNLHFFYLVESYLLKLTKKGAKYAVIFFEHANNFYASRPDIMSLRSQLKLHLGKNTDIVVHSFLTFKSSEWRTFLIDQHPYFLMVCDEGISVPQTYFFILLIISALGNKLDVVLTSGQRFDELRLYGYHVSASFSHSMYIKQNNRLMLTVLNELFEFSAKSYEGCLQDLQLRNTKKEIEKNIKILYEKWDKAADIRSIVCVLSCSAVLRIYIEKAENRFSDFMVLQDDSDFTMDEAADLCKLYCLSVAVLLLLPLSQRIKLRSINATWNKPALSCLKMQNIFEYISLNITKGFADTTDWNINWKHITDISDSVLLKNIAYYCEEEKNAGHKSTFGKEIEEEYTFLWETILQIIPESKMTQSCELRTTSRQFLLKGSSITEKSECVVNPGLIRAKSDIAEEYAGNILDELPLLNSAEIASEKKGKPFDELLHWHSGRPLSDDYERTKSNYGVVKDARALKQYQKLQNFHHFAGKSLTSSASKTIVVQQDVPEKKTAAEKVIVKKKKSQATKKEKIIEENQKRISAKEENKEAVQWKTIAASIQKEIKEDFFPGIKKLDLFITSTHTHTVRYLAEMKALQCSFEVWVEHCGIRGEKKNLDIAVETMKRIQKLLNNYQDMLTKEDQQTIAKYLSYLGFENLAMSLASSKTNYDDDKKIKCTVGIGAARFQLQHMGPYLLRDDRTDPDVRVPHFIPDTWQRKLLDVVDNNESAVIVAPTSSGKTYASYYCMEKVLSQGHEGVVVYVSPTKALVNQIVTTVNSQFNKALPNGVALCGVFTRDYRTDALNCQILVTVPQCLEILLLSPHRQAWVKKIKYVIFDEVHCLGGEIGGQVWEHLLVMIRCPFLALTATISNPENLAAWLQSVKHFWRSRDLLIEKKGKERKIKSQKTQKMSYRVHLVLYDKRYNDLEKYVCSVNHSSLSFQHFHPCAALTVDHVMKYGMPKDLSLSPRESIQLYDTMETIWPEWPRKRELYPEEYKLFKNKVTITKNDAKMYEEELKKELIDWTQNGHPEKACNVLKSLQPPEPSDDVNCLSYFPKLVEKLKEEQKLPALFFGFRLDLVEQLALKLAFFQKEKADSKVLLSEKETKKLESKAKRLGKSLQKHVSSDETKVSLINMANFLNIQEMLVKNNEIPPDCTYANTKAANNEVLMEIFHRTSWSKKAGELRFLARRGIGYHHASVDTKGRQLVEMLFRMGYIRVVTATGSLALGINMPCKSVVFFHDSVYLDALNYRQMSGRAGRRGQDVLGNVFFFTIPMPKVKKLMKSDVPELKGQFPFSISLVLRLMLLAAKADDKEDASAKVLSLLNHSMMSFNKKHETKMIKLYFLFCLHFLIHEGFLDEYCNPLDLTGLVTHLHFHEPSNFVFVSFLENGLFHQLLRKETKDVKHFSKYVMETLVLILANLFGHRFLLPSFLKYKESFHQSKVFLEGLPEEFASAVKDYNNKIATIFGHYLLAVSHLANMKEEYKLPLSQIDFAGEEYKDSKMINHLMNCTKRRSAVSPFACLSGNTDHDLFHSENVSSIFLQTVKTSDAHIPLLHLERSDASGRKLSLNAYALDFFKHGSLDAVEKENGIHGGTAYYLLKDFSLVIASISVSLREICEDENDPVVLAFEQLNTMYKEKLNVAFPSYRKMFT